MNKQVEINSLVFRYLKSITDIVPLGSPFPSHDYLNPPKLLQILSQLSRDRTQIEPQPVLSGNV
ncbi:hypothetical protein, partial [Glaesserella parasuis]